MQDDELDILGALTSLLRTVKETNKLMAKPLDQWSRYNGVLKKMVEEDGEKNVYQMQKLENLEQSKKVYS